MSLNTSSVRFLCISSLHVVHWSFNFFFPIAVINAAMDEEVPKTSTEVCDHHMERTAEDTAVPIDTETATSVQDGKVCAFIEVCKIRHRSVKYSLNFYFYNVVAIKKATCESSRNICSLAIRGTQSSI